MCLKPGMFKERHRKIPVIQQVNVKTYVRETYACPGSEGVTCGPQILHADAVPTPSRKSVRIP